MVYQTERYGLGEDFSYRVPMEGVKDGKYTLILKFSECYFWEPQMKIFDVAIGDKTVLQNLDIFSMAGHKTIPHDEFIEVVLRKGELYINGEKNTGGLKNKHLIVKFKLGKVDNPKINAILLVEGGPENTHKDSFDAFKMTLMDIA